jgi:hypothetical protein
MSADTPKIRVIGVNEAVECDEILQPCEMCATSQGSISVRAYVFNFNGYRLHETAAGATFDVCASG